MRKVTVFMLILGVCFIAFGIFRGEVMTVLDKGIKLCLECVGIG